MTCYDCGGGLYEYGPAVTKRLDEYKTEDKEARAESFHPEELLPLLWSTLWERSGLSYKKKVFTWMQILVQLSTIAHASNITWDKGKYYCPLVKNCEFPRDQQYYRPDGLPMWITLKWTDWKGRPIIQKLLPPIKVLLHRLCW